MKEVETGKGTVPIDWLPWLTWPRFFYKQQIEYMMSDKWQEWFIGGIGTGKTLVLYWNLVGHLLGPHPKALGKPPIRSRVLVPDFGKVEDIALEKLLQNQRIILPKLLTDVQQRWIDFLVQNNALVDYKEKKWIEIGPMLPKSMIKGDRIFKKEHRGIELINGSSIWWVTGEQGWMSMRGTEHDIVGMDEENPWDEFNQLMRGLRNAKGGGRIYGSLTPPYKEGQGPTWTKEKIVDASMTDPDIHVITACMADNPAITPKFIEQWSQGKTQQQIDVEVYGKYPAWGDLVHPDYQDFLWDEKKVTGHLLPNTHPIPDRYEVDWVMAFDWHQAKPCAAVFGWIDRVYKNIYFFDELDKDLAKNKTIDELAKLFLSIEGQPHYKRNFQRWQDPSAKSKSHAVERGFNAWDAFRKAGIVTAAGKNRDPDVGISLVNQYFRGNGKDTPRIFIYERCKYLRQYLKNHYWVRSESGKAVPDPKWSDYPITVRYIIQEVSWKLHTGKPRLWPLQSFVKSKSDKVTIDLSRLEARL